jgi:hypothetical protein
VSGSKITLDRAVELTRTGDLWLFRGRSGADRAIRGLTNAPVNHVGMAVVIDDLPPLLWHAELGRALPDVWSGTHHRGVQLHDLRAAVLQWGHRYGQRAWLRQLTAPAEAGDPERATGSPARSGNADAAGGPGPGSRDAPDGPVSRHMEDALLRTIARLDGTPFPSTTRLATRWLRGRLPTPFPSRAAPDRPVPGTGPSAPGSPGSDRPGTGPSGTGPSGTGPSGTGPSGTGPSGTGPSGSPSGTGQPGTGQSGGDPSGPDLPPSGLPGCDVPGCDVPGTDVPGSRLARLARSLPRPPRPRLPRPRRPRSTRLARPTRAHGAAAGLAEATGDEVGRGPAADLETAYCAEVVAVTYEEMGLLPRRRRPNWYDPGRFWSGDDLELAPGYRLGGEIAVVLPPV